MRHPLLAVAFAIAALSASVSGSQAATVPAGLTPVALSSTGPIPSCPTPKELDGTLVADTVRKLLRRAETVDADQDMVGFYSSLLVFVLQLNPVATVAVCDPEVASAGRPLGPLTGSAALVPPADIAGFGLRVRGAPATEARSAAGVGDRYTLPSVGPQATVTVSLRTSSGAATVTAGPFDSAPTEVRVEGTATAPVAVVALASGATVIRPVTAPAAVRTTVSARALKGRGSTGVLSLKIRSASGAIVSALDEASSGDPEDLLADPGVTTVADASGRAELRLSPFQRRGRTVVSVLDPGRRTLLQTTCSYRLRGDVLQRVRCGTPRLAKSPPRSASFTPAFAGQLAAHRTETQPTPADPALGVAARAVAFAAVDLTTVLRIPRAEHVGVGALEESGSLLGDLNGDGRPELSSAFSPTDQSLLLSRPSGWSKVPVEIAPPSPLLAVPDLTGDGVDDLVLEFEPGRIYAGSPVWATAPPAALNLGPRTAIGANDLQLASTAEGVSVGQLFGFPDTSGDGRLEIGMESTAGSGLGVFSSESLPLGRKRELPLLQTTAMLDDVRALEGFGTLFDSIDDDDEETLGDAIGPELSLEAETSLLGVRGGTLAFRTEYAAPAADGRLSTTVTLHRLSTTAPWSFSSIGAPIVVPGAAKVVDFDPITGESLLVTLDEGCDRRLRCVTRFRRIDGAGRVGATLSVRDVTRALEARFTNDGPDADDRLEVLIHEASDENHDGTTRPGLRGTIALWASSRGTAALSTLPMLQDGSGALTVGGPLSHWTAPDGRRFHAGRAVAGEGKGRTERLVLIGGLR